MQKPEPETGIASAVWFAVAMLFGAAACFSIAVLIWLVSAVIG